MSGKRFRARAKTVQKWSRDGLIEQNKATGEEKRISQRTADISFGPDRTAEQAAGHRAAQRTAGDAAHAGKKRRKQPRPVQQTAEEAVWASTPEPETPPPTPDAPSMRMAADAPMIAPTVASEEPPPPASRKRRKRKNRKKVKQRQTAKYTPKPVSMRGADDVPTQNRPPGENRKAPRRLVEGGGRLKFELAEDKNQPVSDAKGTENAKQKLNRKQVRRFSPDAAQTTATSGSRPARLMDDGGGRLHFDRTVDTAPVSNTEKSVKSVEIKQAAKKRQVLDYAANTVKMEDDNPIEPSVVDLDSTADTHHRDDTFFPDEPQKSPAIKAEQPIPTDGGGTDTHSRDSPPSLAESQELLVISDNSAVYQRRQAQYAAKPDKPRLHFEDTPPLETAASAAPAASATENVPPRQQKKNDKAVRRTERAEQEVERAREKLPAKRRLTVQREVDTKTGKPHRRLRFEKEIQPEYRPPSLPARAAGMAKTAAVLKLHGKIHESEQQNVAVEATHKSELFAEQGAGRILRWEKNRRRSKPYRALRHAEQKAAKEHINLAWQTALRDNPELRKKNSLAKLMQKQKIKRKYAQAAHEAKQTAHFTQNVVNATGQIVRAIAQYAAARKSLLAVVAMLALTVVFFSAGLTSCTAMLSAFQSSYISASYMANEQDICNADLYFTELETDLQMDINETAANYPGYDGYRYNIGEISHNPYELMGYLSTVFNAFTFDQIKGEIERLFGEQYLLTRTEVIENGRHILQTTLTVKPLSEIIAASLTPGEQTDRYQIYMQTLGNRQAYGNPFDFPWLGYVSSGYGYRVHPITGEKNLHRGVDIAVAEGTPVRAIQDGRVVSAGDTGSYGLCVVIEDNKDYQSRYAHCSSLNVSMGQEVKRGDIIAAVGNTGQSTGPHLHLEVILDGEYLNPYYFVDTGEDGTSGTVPGVPGGPTIPDYPGEPPTDDTFSAMLTEAEKYLGYPYVWGGSSPSTSFDCSGFVSWVINHSGWDVGRLGAQGLYNICTPVSATDVQPGDLVFFWHTYDAPNPNGVTHVGIYVGSGQMIHCGNPISYANLNSTYWQSHFYGYARLP